MNVPERKLIQGVVCACLLAPPSLANPIWQSFFEGIQTSPDSIATCNRLLTLKPDDSDALDARLTELDAALKENPMEPENHIRLGQALQSRGDFSQAEKEYKLAIQLTPGRQNSKAQQLLAVLGSAQREATQRVNMVMDKRRCEISV